MTTIYSFGYKMNGEDQFATTGSAAPRIYDCRILNNPHNDPKLRRMTGRDKEVQDMVASSAMAQAIIQDAVSYLRDNPDGVVAFGCSYGKHRSVALAEITAARLGGKLACVPVKVIHTGAAK